MNINKNVDLDKSFDKLKEKLFEAVDKIYKDVPGKYGLAFGLLESAVKIHLSECTDETFGDIQKQVDDIPKTLFKSPHLK